MSKATSKCGSGQVAAFLQKVVEILDGAPNEVAGWSRLGDSFFVKDVKRFSSNYLAMHFKSAQFSSFVRQLNFYGFHKLQCNTKKVWQFKHECFIRGRPDLMANIKRKTSAEYHSANKGEVTELRAKVGELTGELQRANDHTAALAELVRHLATPAQLARMTMPEHVVDALRSAGVRGRVQAGPWKVPRAGVAGAGAIDTSMQSQSATGAPLVRAPAAGPPSPPHVQKRARVDDEDEEASDAAQSSASSAATGGSSPFSTDDAELDSSDLQALLGGMTVDSPVETADAAKDAAAAAAAETPTARGGAKHSRNLSGMTDKLSLTGELKHVRNLSGMLADDPTFVFASPGPVATAPDSTVQAASEMDWGWADQATGGAGAGAGAGSADRKSLTIRANTAAASTPTPTGAGAMAAGGFTSPPPAQGLGEMTPMAQNAFLTAVLMSAAATGVSLSSPRGSRTPAGVFAEPAAPQPAPLNAMVPGSEA